jgi:hypothetical protein
MTVEHMLAQGYYLPATHADIKSTVEASCGGLHKHWLPRALSLMGWSLAAVVAKAGHHAAR